MENRQGESIAAVAAEHGFSEGAARALLEAMRRSGGAMAQFSHPELGGMGQWSRGGMLMIGDMFNDELKGRVGALALALSREIAAEAQDAWGGLPPLRRESAGRWWPEELGHPASTGAQNGIRYAVFPAKRRIAVEQDGKLSIRDTGENAISGVAQQAGGKSSLRFSGSLGTIDLRDLPEVSR